MNRDAIAAIAELTASAGVLISLDYLGLQIRSQIVESRLESSDALSRQPNSGYQTSAGLYGPRCDPRLQSFLLPVTTREDLEVADRLT